MNAVAISIFYRQNPKSSAPDPITLPWNSIRVSVGSYTIIHFPRLHDRRREPSREASITIFFFLSRPVVEIERIAKWIVLKPSRFRRHESGSATIISFHSTNEAPPSLRPSTTTRSAVGHRLRPFRHGRTPTRSCRFLFVATITTAIPETHKLRHKTLPVAKALAAIGFLGEFNQWSIFAAPHNEEFVGFSQIWRIYYIRNGGHRIMKCSETIMESPLDYTWGDVTGYMSAS